MMVSVWQRSEDRLRTLKLPYSTTLSRPVRPDDLNTTQYVIMVGLDTNVNLLGYSVIKVDITDDAGNNGISGNTINISGNNGISGNAINISENNDTTDATTEDLELITETLGILQADHQFPTSVDDEKLAMYPGYYYQKGDIEIYVLDEAVEENSDVFQTNFFASGTMQLNIMTIGKETLSGVSVIDFGNMLVDQALNGLINSGVTTTAKPGSHVWNNWEANGLKGQWCFLNPMPACLLVSFEYNGNYYFIGYTAGTQVTSKTKGLMDAVISSIRPAGGVTISNSTSSISPFTEPTSNQEITATCNTNKVNVRTEPDGSRSIGQINKGDKVTVLETQGEWSRINCKHGEGWVKTKFLQ